MSRRKKQILLIVLLIIVLILIYLLFRRGSQPTPTPATIVVTEEEPATPSPSVVEQQQVRAETAGLQALAKTFAERYGSFSSESNFANLVDVIPLMTDSFATETRNFIETAEIPQELYTVSTRVITVEVDEINEDAGFATLTLNTQREESKGSAQNISVRYQPIVLTFRFISGAWKVSSATWE